MKKKRHQFRLHLIRHHLLHNEIPSPDSPGSHLYSLYPPGAYPPGIWRYRTIEGNGEDFPYLIMNFCSYRITSDILCRL